MNKNASAQIGGGIIIVGILLLLGGIFFDDYTISSDSSSNRNPSSTTSQDYKLFHINDTNIGSQQKTTQSYPNIELGSKTQYTTLLVEPFVELRSNPFTVSETTFTINPQTNKNIEQYLIYGDPEIVSGDAILEIYSNNSLVTQKTIRENSFPLSVRELSKTPNKSTEITMKLKKPSFFSLFSWNKLQMEDFRIVEQSRNTQNSQREFNFQIDKTFLNRTTIQLSISCDEIKETSDPIKVTVNEYIVTNENPQCDSNYNTIDAKIPQNILKEDKNSLELETNGYYKLGYSINNIYFNDQQTYKFTINSFDDIVDVVMYGDFNKDVIDIRLNNQIMTLERDEIKSIVQYLRFGTNELEILTKPVEIEEFTIEKNEFN